MDDHPLRRLADDPGVSVLGRSLIASAQDDVPTPDGRARAAKRFGIAAVLAAGAGAGSEAGAVAAVWKLLVVLVALGGVVGLAVRQSPASEPELPTWGGIGAHAAPHAPGGDAVTPAPLPPPSSPSSSSSSSSASPPSSSSSSPSSPSSLSSPGAIARAAAAQPSAPPRPPSRVSRPGQPAPVAPQPTTVASLAPAVQGPEASAPDPGPDPGHDLPVAPASEAPGTAGAPEVTAPSQPEVAGAAGVAGEPAGPSRLAAEVALVDRARTSLRAGDNAAALAALAEYHQRFASGDLDAEAEVVMIETLIAKHELQRAVALGTAFFARFPRSPLAQRVHSLLDRLPK